MGQDWLGCLLIPFNVINPVTRYSKNITTGVRFDPAWPSKGI